MHKRVLNLVSIAVLAFVFTFLQGGSYAFAQSDNVVESSITNGIEEVDLESQKDSNVSTDQSTEKNPTSEVETELEPRDENVNKNSDVEADTLQQSTTIQLFNTSVQTKNEPKITYTTHVQSKGWLNPVSNGKTSGTTGESKRLEAIKIKLENAPKNSGIQYRTHVQSYGWQGWKENDALSGTQGQAKRLEAIEIKLKGEIANQYDVYYRVHAQSYGWLDWAKNGQKAGTHGLSKRLEAIEIQLVEKGGQAPGSTKKPFIVIPSVEYSTHVQKIGWQNFVKDGKLSGTTGQSLRLEAIKIKLNNTPYEGGVEYTTHVQSHGWQDPVSNGKISGTTGEGKRLEAIQIKLTGEMAQYYDIYYRTHVQSFGWLDWAKNGERSGSEGLHKRLESIEIVLVEKGEPAPGATKRTYLTSPSVEYSTHVQSYGWTTPVKDGLLSGTVGEAKRLEAIKINLVNAPFSGGISYRTHVQNYGWLANVSNGKLSGTEGEAKRLEAIEIKLTGEIAKHYDVYYRVHAQSFGWLGWAKNGMKAGTEGRSKRLEAIEIKLYPKGKGPAVSQHSAHIPPVLVFLDPGHGGLDPGATAGKDKYKEKDLNLSVAKKVKSILNKRGFTVYMSREGDDTVELLDRPKMANKINASIFVSIHTNAGTPSVHGIETYYYKYKPQYQPEINKKMHNDPVRVAKSVALAKLVQDKMIDHTGANDRGIKGASYKVIRESTMPAILVEMGFISNSNERNKLFTNSYQDKIAKGIADGITEYFKKY